jgi:hypothetical protein
MKSKGKETPSDAVREAASSAPPTSMSAKLKQAAWLVIVAVLAGGLWVWFGSNPSKQEQGAAGPESSRRIKGNPGPWGDLEYIPILIETPDEFLAVSRQANYELVWNFQNQSVSDLAALFNAAGLSKQERDWLLDQRHWRPVTNGFAITPPPEMLMGVSRAARERIYEVLAQCGGNPLHEMPLSFRRDGLDEWFYKSGLSAPTIALTKSLLYQRGNAWCLSDWPLLLRYIESPMERRRLLKTTSRKATLLVRLRVSPGSDVEPLVGYWGRGGRLKDIRPLLHSLALVPEGISLDVVHLLPRFLRSRIYTYPLPTDNNGKPPPNCFWTTMNFFANDQPDDRFHSPESVIRTLAEDYYPVDEDYLLGDVLLLSKPDGTLLHAAVFVADDVVLTKNGAYHTQPWMFAKMDDMAASYPSREPLKLRAYRRKDL